MPTDKPPSAPLRPADPQRRHAGDAASAGRVFVIMVAVLVAGALLNASTMLERAETSPVGPGRDRALAFWRPAESVSSALGLTTPRAELDALRDTGPTRQSGDPGGRALGDDTAAGNGNVLGHEPLAPSPPPLRPELGLQALPATTVDTRPPAGPSTSSSLPGSATPLGLPDAASSTTNEATGAFALRLPSVTDPLRVLIVGDSTSESVGNSTLRLLADTGLTDARLDYRVSTGLSRPDFFDWPAHLRAVQAEAPAEVVIVMLGANDAQAFIADGAVVAYGTDDWLAIYRTRVSALLDRLTTDGGWVIWVGQPIMRNPDFDSKMIQLNAIVADEIRQRPNARYVDSRSALSDADGAYAGYLVDEAGDRQLVRQNDGIHLTAAGGDRIARIVVETLNTIAPLY